MGQKENKVYVVEELVGDWEEPVTSSLLGIYRTLEQAEKAIKEFANTDLVANNKDIVGFSIAFMEIIEGGTQELYCSIYKHVDELRGKG